MNRRFLKLTLFAGLVSLVCVGCGSSSSSSVEDLNNIPAENVEKVEKKHKTVPALGVKPQENYTKDDGSLDVERYTQTQTKYLKSNE